MIALAMEENSSSPPRDNYILERFLTEIPIPKPGAMTQPSPSKRPRLGSSDQDEGAVFGPSKSPITPKTVLFPSVLAPESPGSAKSACSGKSVKYKDSSFATELQVRGVIMTRDEERPTNWAKLTSILKKPAKNIPVLEKGTIETLNECLAMPGNESTIQAVVVGTLVGINRIFQSRLAYAVFQEQFSSELPLPTLPGIREGITKLASPWPDLTIGLRRKQFEDYDVVLHNLGAIVAPIPCVFGMVFPCFTLEVKGEDSQLDAETQNKNNAAHMLRNLRSLSCRANGEEETCRVLDDQVRAFTATVSRVTVTIWGHWTRAKAGHTYIHSACLQSASLQAIDNNSWQAIHRELVNAISCILETTKCQVTADLAAIGARE